MTTTISIINLKGGVGKTTISVALCDFLRAAHGKRVLLIDLDPQTNATVAFIQQGKWKLKNKNGETIYHLFRDSLDGTKNFDIDKALEKDVSKNIQLEGIGGRLDLLASSLDMIEIQDSILQIAPQSLYAENPSEVIKSAIEPIKHRYDYIIVDCPPNLGVVTLNGIAISDFYLIPTIADYLSTYGIPQILKRVEKFTGDGRKCNIQPLGIVINSKRTLQMTSDVIAELTANPIFPKLFDAKIPLSVRAAEIFDPMMKPKTLAAKYPATIGQPFRELANEVISNVKQRRKEALQPA